MKKTLLLFVIVCLISSLQAQKEKELTLDLVFKSREFSAKRAQGLQPLQDGKRYIQIKPDSINAYYYETGNLSEVIVTSEELIPAGDSTSIPIWGYELSGDESKILFPTDTDPIYRYSSRSNYFVFDLKTRKLTQLSSNGKQGLADFSPDATKVAFVRDNNLFIKNLNSNEEKQITFDGLDRHIINGTTDWVYEEECKVLFYSQPPVIQMQSCLRLNPFRLFRQCELIKNLSQDFQGAYINLTYFLNPIYRLQLQYVGTLVAFRT